MQTAGSMALAQAQTTTTNLYLAISGTTFDSKATTQKSLACNLATASNFSFWALTLAKPQQQQPHAGHMCCVR
jgi:hypothetical protein